MVSFKGEADGKVGQVQLIADFKTPVVILKITKLMKHKKRVLVLHHLMAGYKE